MLRVGPVPILRAEEQTRVGDPIVDCHGHHERRDEHDELCNEQREPTLLEVARERVDDRHRDQERETQNGRHDDHRVDELAAPEQSMKRQAGQGSEYDQQAHGVGVPDRQRHVEQTR